MVARERGLAKFSAFRIVVVWWLRYHATTMLRAAMYIHCLTGRANQNVEPSPGVLSTPTLPRCCSISSLLI